MKNWRHIIIFILMLAMPLSSWASVMVASHCNTPDNTSHSMHTQMDGDAHMGHQMPSEHLSDHSDCECGCDGNIYCSVSGCSVSALSNAISVDPIYITQPVYLSIKALVILVDPGSLFRPPISLS